jgi:hypothetical protein
LSAGTGIDISGSGTAADPFVIVADQVFSVVDNSVFNLTLTGAGTGLNPWALQVAFAATAKLDDLPDVNAPTPTNGQVLGYDTATQKWTPRAPTTAPTGAVTHDTTLTGDGSVGAPLGVIGNSDRLITTGAAGVGMTDYGYNQTTRQYTDDTDRNTSTGRPAPIVNTLSMLSSKPGEVDYWTGAQWNPLKGSFDFQTVGGALLELSGPYAGSRLTKVIRNVVGTSDDFGIIDILDAVTLSGRGGVLSCQVSLYGAVNQWCVMVMGTGVVQARLVDALGVLKTNAPYSASVDAWVY